MWVLNKSIELCVADAHADDGDGGHGQGKGHGKDDKVTSKNKKVKGNGNGKSMSESLHQFGNNLKNFSLKDVDGKFLTENRLQLVKSMFDNSIKN